MTKYWIIAISVLASGTLVFLFLWRMTEARLKMARNSLETVNKELDKAMAELAKLEASLKVLVGNRKVADEKIGNLRDGDTLGNAIDILLDRQD
jgi:septal ring factor EnvC (AmiA/AmiB activator)